MNTDVFILFLNAFLTTVLSSAIVIWILRKQYLPVIKKLEAEEKEKETSTPGIYSENHKGGAV